MHPDVELKQQIEAFKSEKQGAKREFVSDQRDVDIMDTSTG